MNTWLQSEEHVCRKIRFDDVVRCIRQQSSLRARLRLMGSRKASGGVECSEENIDNIRVAGVLGISIEICSDEELRESLNDRQSTERVSVGHDSLSIVQPRQYQGDNGKDTDLISIQHLHQVGAILIVVNHVPRASKESKKRAGYFVKRTNRQRGDAQFPSKRPKSSRSSARRPVLRHRGLLWQIL